MYQFAGVINSLFVILSLYGILLQLKLIWERQSNKTELLSLNQFTVSYFAYFSFFVFGYSVEPFNHFMVWPRLIACILVLTILLEIYKDRSSRRSRFVFCVALLSLLLGMSGLLVGTSLKDESNFFSTVLILVVSGLLAQGYIHQIWLVYQSGNTGAIDIRMSQFILAMDFSTIFLAFTMGFENSWPMVVLASISGITKLIIMYLFRWTRLSKRAQNKRNLYKQRIGC
ncbi:hypothetical protein [Aliikangiella sp. G2MR2-5]|uniref:hypothetical protein n=1 Tax=Aliikangiella sp. G2MR2-5 TaxID=2788943 RepID=UPI0018AA1306|nr:hypothetical protein [Aliikangiella sp. G2MR2-5]